MFYTLLLATFGIAFLVSWLTSRFFETAAERILKRVIQDEISSAWVRYLKFALLVVGISSGVRIYELERFISTPAYNEKAAILELTPARWTLEVYRTVIGSLQGLAWVLLVFFVVALLGFVAVRLIETLRRNREPTG
ncbi:MAG TPA: hypothetical protein VK178_09225 [Opitutaceae bacterium]|nr:hypothetical protein [Opitutaceae bacterium]